MTDWMRCFEVKIHRQIVTLYCTTQNESSREIHLDLDNLGGLIVMKRLLHTTTRKRVNVCKMNKQLNDYEQIKTYTENYVSRVFSLMYLLRLTEGDLESIVRVNDISSSQNQCPIKTLVP